MRLGVTITRLEQFVDACRLHLSDGTLVDANVVVVGIGSVPNTELAEAIGLHVEDGIRVDPSMRSTNPAIFAAGDVASHWNEVHDRQVRLESWQDAERQGAIAAKAMLGQAPNYCETPWFWTDQFGTNVQIVGVPASYDNVVVRGRREDDRFSVLQLSNDRIVGGVFVNEGAMCGRYARQSTERLK